MTQSVLVLGENVMTLRVRISIVPFGDEEKEREIHQINISNLGDTGDKFGFYLYGVEVDKYKTGEYDFKVEHMRQHGALQLVNQVLERVVK
jgi:hypothetical protein